MVSGLKALNHLSLVCRDVQSSRDFYKNVLGFGEILRPNVFTADGVWLFHQGVGLHLIVGEPLEKPSEIDPRADHMSFQADNMEEIFALLRENNVYFIQRTLNVDGISVDQVFFHDPDHNMIEICNCDSIPVVPLQSQKTPNLCVPTPSLQPAQKC